MKTIDPGNGGGNNLGPGVTAFPKRPGAAGTGRGVSGRNVNKQASFVQLSDYRQAKMKAEAAAAQKEKKPENSNVDFTALQGEFGSLLGQVEEKFARREPGADSRNDSDDRENASKDDEMEGETGPSAILSAPFSPGFAAGLMAFGSFHHLSAKVESEHGKVGPDGQSNGKAATAKLSTPGEIPDVPAAHAGSPEKGKTQQSLDTPDASDFISGSQGKLSIPTPENLPKIQGKQPGASKQMGAESKDLRPTSNKTAGTLMDQMPIGPGGAQSPAPSPTLQVADRIVQEVPNLSSVGVANTIVLQTPRVLAITLHPEGLGDVSVRLSSSNGKIKISLDSDLPSTSDSLKAGSAELVKALQQVLPGFAADNLDFSSKDQSAQNQAPGQNFNNPNFSGDGSQSGQLQHGGRQDGSGFSPGTAQDGFGHSSADAAPQSSGVRRDAAGDIYL